jgi:lipopolysaccharide export system protein LptC
MAAAEKPQAPKRGGFWDQPAVTAAMPGKTYTRLVRGLRLLLPLVAVSVIGMVMAWPRVENTMAPIRKEVKSAAATPVGKNELLNPTFNGVDKNNEPYTVSAAHAVQSMSERDTVLLDQPRGEIQLEGGRKLGGEAVKGTYVQKEGRLLLEDGVTLHDDEGNLFRTAKLLVNLHTREAWADQRVEGSGPAGALEASGMRADSANGVLIFTGPAKLTLTHVKGL